jgi:hypothetical protein
MKLKELGRPGICKGVPPAFRSKPPTEYPTFRVGKKAAKTISSLPSAWRMLSRDAFSRGWRRNARAMASGRVSVWSG